jgi:Fe-S-cluster containining protein
MSVNEIHESVLHRLADRKHAVEQTKYVIAQKMLEAFPASLEQVVNQKLKRIELDNASVKSKIKKLQLLTSEVRQVTQDLVPCKRGCSACCHVKVEMSQDEAEIIGDFLKITPKKLPKGIRMLSQSALGRADTPCPFLKNHECSIYEVRPIACRNYVVMDVDNLLCGFENEALALAEDPRAVPVPSTRAQPIFRAYLSLAKNQTWADIRQFFPDN